MGRVWIGPVRVRAPPLPAASHAPLRYLPLLVGGCAWFFVYGRWPLPIAAWVAPTMLVRFLRTHRLRQAVALVAAVLYVVLYVEANGLIREKGAVYLLIIALITSLTLVPYLVDRLLSPWHSSLFGTLIFPLSSVAVELLASLANPYGTYNSVAYTQYGNLPLMQLSAITGTAGITFLVTWFASLANLVWERGGNWRETRTSVALYVAVLLVILAGGEARLVVAPTRSETVRVAGLVPSQAAVDAYEARMDDARRQLAAAPETTAPAGAARAQFLRASAAAYSPITDDLLTRSDQEAKAGAKLVVWSEGATKVLDRGEEEALLRRGADVARRDAIYLDMGVVVLSAGDGAGDASQDRSILVDPSGHVAWEYDKAHLFPGDPSVPGSGTIPVVGTPYGRLASVICFDMDFPGQIRQAGLAGADILLAPSEDWEEVDPYHTQIATFRAVENGFALVRPTDAGLSIAVDAAGRVLAATDYFGPRERTMVANVPTTGVRTVYAVVGDLVSWLCLGGLAGLVIVTLKARFA